MKQITISAGLLWITAIVGLHSYDAWERARLCRIVARSTHVNPYAEAMAGQCYVMRPGFSRLDQHGLSGREVICYFPARRAWGSLTDPIPWAQP